MGSLLSKASRYDLDRGPGRRVWKLTENAWLFRRYGRWDLSVFAELPLRGRTGNEFAHAARTVGSAEARDLFHQAGFLRCTHDFYDCDSCGRPVPSCELRRAVDHDWAGCPGCAGDAWGVYDGCVDARVRSDEEMAQRAAKEVPCG